jgi:hypothetical protein
VATLAREHRAMSWRALGVLSAVAVLALLLDVFGPGRQVPPPAAGMAGQLLLPQLASDRARVTRIEVQPRHGPGVSLLRGTHGWWLPQVDAPADAELVQSWLTRLARARILEPKTRLPTHYALLDVADPGHAGAGMALQLSGAQVMPQVLIGRYDARLQGTFVRLRGHRQSLLVAGDVTPPSRAVDWMRHPLLSLPASAVLQIDLTSPQGARFLLDRSLDGTPRLVTAPRGLRQPLTLGSLLLGIFDGLDYSGVQARSATPPQALRLRALLSDGSLLTLSAWRERDGHALGNLSIQAPIGGLPPAAAAGLARTAARVQAHTWVLAPDIWSLLRAALNAGDAPLPQVSPAALPPAVSGRRPAQTALRPTPGAAVWASLRGTP